MISNQKKAQTTIEYLLLLGIVAAVVFIALAPGGLLERGQQSADGFFDEAALGIMGNEPFIANGM